MPLAILRAELDVTFTVIDTNNAQVSRKKTFEIAATGATDADKVAAGFANAQLFLTDLAAMTEAQVTATAFRAVSVDGDAVTAIGTVHKEAVISLALDDAGYKKATLYLPAPADAILANGRTVDPAAAGVGDFLANFMSGADNTARISDGETIRDNTPILRSRVRTVKSGRTY